MPVTMTSGSKRGKSLGRLGPHRLSTRRKKRRKKKRSKSLLTWSLIRLKKAQDRRTPPQATDKTMRISLDLGLALPVSGMRCDPCLRDRGGYGWLRT